MPLIPRRRGKVIRDIQAKTILSRVKQPDPWFGLRFTMNLYRGCQHQCIYCDSRSDCYGIEDFGDVLVKVNAPGLLRDELARIRRRGTIGTGSMNDPYMPLEEQRGLTRQALQAIAEHRFPVHVLTKSDLVRRDADLLQEIGATYAAVSFTITTLDDGLASRVEPGAPSPARRLQALRELARRGVLTGVLLMPVLPFLEDDDEAVLELLARAADGGAQYVVAWFGVTLRDRQRRYFHERLDELFPGLRDRYQRTFGGRYECPSPRAERLAGRFTEACERHGLAMRMPVFAPEARQLDLF